MVRPRQISDQEIVCAARETFLAHGPTTAVAQVAERLGVSAAALFQRAGSKTDLMLLALAPGPPPTLGVWAAEPSRDRSISAQLLDQLAELLSFFATLVPSLIVLRAAGLFPPPKRQRRRRRAPGGGPSDDVPMPVALRQQLGSWLCVASQQGRIRLQDPYACAESLLGAMEARCFNAHVGGPAYVRGEDREFLAMLVAGLLVDLESD